MKEQVKQIQAEGKLIEAACVFAKRTEYDVEMLREWAIQMVSKTILVIWMDVPEGEPPFTLLDFFPEDFLIMVDESHIMGQIKGMYNGDRSRKEMLVNYGFRLPSALDNRPLRREEFESHVHQVFAVSATPGDYELEQTDTVVISNNPSDRFAILKWKYVRRWGKWMTFLVKSMLVLKKVNMPLSRH